MNLIYAVVLLLVGGVLFLGGYWFGRTSVQRTEIVTQKPAAKRKTMRYNPADMLAPVVDGEIEPVTPKQHRAYAERHGGTR